MNLTRRTFLAMAAGTAANCAAGGVFRSPQKPHVPVRPRSVSTPSVPSKLTDETLITVPVYTPAFVAHEISRWHPYAVDLIEKDLSAPVRQDKINLRKNRQPENVLTQSGTWFPDRKELILTEIQIRARSALREYCGILRKNLSYLDIDRETWAKEDERYSEIQKKLMTKGVAGAPQEWITHFDKVLARVQLQMLEEARNTIAHELSHAVLDTFNNDNVCTSNKGLFTHPDYEGPSSDDLTKLFVQQTDPDYFAKGAEIRQTMKNAMDYFLTVHFGLRMDHLMVRGDLGLDITPIRDILKQGLNHTCTPEEHAFAEQIDQRKPFAKIADDMGFSYSELKKAQAAHYKKAVVAGFSTETLARYVVALITNYHGYPSDQAFHLDKDMKDVFRSMRFRGKLFFQRNLEIFGVTEELAKEAVDPKNYHSRPATMRITEDLRDRSNYTHNGRVYNWNRPLVRLQGEFQEARV